MFSTRHDFCPILGICIDFVCAEPLVMRLLKSKIAFELNKCCMKNLNSYYFYNALLGRNVASPSVCLSQSAAPKMTPGIDVPRLNRLSEGKYFFQNRYGERLLD